MALIIAVQLPIMMAAIAFLMVRAERQDGLGIGSASPGSLARSIAENVMQNPIVDRHGGRASSGGSRAFRSSGIVADLVNRLADVASTLALFAMGMSLKKYGVRGHVAPGLVLTLLKLMLMPAAVLLLAHAVGLPPMPTKVAVIAAACPTGVTPFLVAGRFRTGEGLASTTITLSTVLAVLSVTLWLKVVEWL